MIGYTYLVFLMLWNNDVNSFTILSRHINGVYSWHFYGTIAGVIINSIVAIIAAMVSSKNEKAAGIKEAFIAISFSNIIYGSLAVLTDSTIIKTLHNASSFSDFPVDKVVTILLGLTLVFYWQTMASISSRKSSLHS